MIKVKKTILNQFKLLTPIELKKELLKLELKKNEKDEILFPFEVVFNNTSMNFVFLNHYLTHLDTSNLILSSKPIAKNWLNFYQNYYKFNVNYDFNYWSCFYLSKIKILPELFPGLSNPKILYLFDKNEKLTLEFLFLFSDYFNEPSMLTLILKYFFNIKFKFKKNEIKLPKEDEIIKSTRLNMDKMFLEHSFYFFNDFIHYINFVLNNKKITKENDEFELKESLLKFSKSNKEIYSSNKIMFEFLNSYFKLIYQNKSNIKKLVNVKKFFQHIRILLESEKKPIDIKMNFPKVEEMVDEYIQLAIQNNLKNDQVYSHIFGKWFSIFIDKEYFESREFKIDSKILKSEMKLISTFLLAFKIIHCTIIAYNHEMNKPIKDESIIISSQLIIKNFFLLSIIPDKIDDIKTDIFSIYINLLESLTMLILSLKKEFISEEDIYKKMINLLKHKECLYICKTMIDNYFDSKFPIKLLNNIFIEISDNLNEIENFFYIFDVHSFIKNKLNFSDNSRMSIIDFCMVSNKNNAINYFISKKCFSFFELKTHITTILINYIKNDDIHKLKILLDNYPEVIWNEIKIKQKNKKEQSLLDYSLEVKALKVQKLLIKELGLDLIKEGLSW